MTNSYGTFKWSKPIRGDQLSAERIDGLPDLPGLYMWRRAIMLSPECLFKSELFRDWILAAASVPLLKTDELLFAKPDGKMASIRPAFARTSQIVIGGGELSRKKLMTLSSIALDSKTRGGLYDLIRETTDTFGPVLYVGEAASLKSRIGEHCKPGSPLQLRLRQHQLTIEDTTLVITPLPAASKEERQLAEQVLTHILVAPYTFRAG